MNWLVDNNVPRGVTTVLPVLLKGWGCEASRLEAMLMVMSP